jgi:GTP cyclohydrolase I
LLPFFGYVSIGYIPDGKIMGLSKFQRLVDKVASKPTVQENVTMEIANAVEMYLKPKGVGVVVNCQHTCMFGRGIERPEIGVSSQVLLGNFKQNIHTRQEFFNRIRE